VPVLAGQRPVVPGRYSLDAFTETKQVSDALQAATSAFRTIPKTFECYNNWARHYETA
jgi:hypothetical protein